MLTKFGDSWIDTEKIQAVCDWTIKADVLLEHGSILTVESETLAELRSWLSMQDENDNDWAEHELQWINATLPPKQEPRFKIVDLGTLKRGDFFKFPNCAAVYQVWGHGYDDNVDVWDMRHPVLSSFTATACVIPVTAQFTNMMESVEKMPKTRPDVKWVEVSALKHGDLCRLTEAGPVQMVQSFSPSGWAYVCEFDSVFPTTLSQSHKVIPVTATFTNEIIEV